MNNHRGKRKSEQTTSVADLRRRYDKNHMPTVRQLESGALRRNGTPRNGDGKVIKLWYVCKERPFATSENGAIDDEDYTIVTRHLFKKLTVCILIPKSAKIVEVPEYPESPAHYRVRFGDGFCFFPKESFGNLKPGDIIEGTARVEVKKVEKPNNQSVKTGYYPNLSFEDPLYGDEPTFFADFDLQRRFVPKGSIDFTPTSGSKRTILHLTKMEPVSSGITIKRK